MTDLVVVSLESWDAVWRRNQHLVSRLLRDDPDLRVLFVEPPADPMHTVRRRAVPHRGAGLHAGPVVDGFSGRLQLFQGTKAFPRRVDPTVDARLADQVVRAARELGFEDPLLWVNDASAATLMRRAGWRTLYDVTDDWLHAGHTPREHDRLVADEAALLRNAAQVVVCSPALLAAKAGPRPTTLVPNAVDLAAYASPGPRPADLPAGPVALYLGTIHTDRVDLDLCVATARALGGSGCLVLVGPAPLSVTDRRRLQQAGVHVMGARDHHEIPAYLMHADVLVVPHVVSPFTDSLDPIKLYEYRAAGRPVVSTPVAGFRAADDPMVRVADAADFPQVVRTTLTNPTIRESRSLRPPNWDERAATMRGVLHQVATSRRPVSHPTVAIAHDYLTQRGGAERVVLAMHRAFPEATIYTTLYEPDGTYPEFRDAHIVTSPLNEVVPLRRNHRAALPLLPFAARSLRITEDVVLASSSGWAHGFRATGLRLVYCHAPARWLYQSDAYLGSRRRDSVRGMALAALTPWLKRWDRRHALAADRHLANSHVVRDRIRDAYGIEAPVLPAPHGMDAEAHQEAVPQLDDWTGYYLVVSRLLPYKNVDAAVEAFRDLDERLVVVGHGPLRRSLEARLPRNVRLVSGLTDGQLRWTYARSRALVAPSLEDYGLTPLEAAAYGKPTLALEAGGYLDTVVRERTGLFFAQPTAAAIRAAVLENRERAWSAPEIVAHAARFDETRFQTALREHVAELTGSSLPVP